MWTRRLALVEKLEPAASTPPRLAPYKALGASIYELAETGDYAALLDDIIIAWYNPVVDALSDAFKYQLAMGLIPSRAQGGFPSKGEQ